MAKNLRKFTVRTNVSLQESDGKKTIVGIIPFNSESVDMGFREVITPQAFAKTVNDGFDVKALYNHDDSKVLGRVANGSLKLTVMDDGLHCECILPDVSYANDAYNLIKDSYNSQMSFGFYPVKQEREVNEAGEVVVYLQEVKLFEVSFCVAFPAYEATDSVARSMMLRGVDLDGLLTVANKPSLEDGDYMVIESVTRALQDFIAPKQVATTSAVAEASENTEAGVFDEVRSFLDAFMMTR